MPNFPVSEVPVQVSQTITQGALIRNVGASTVYLDASSAVSPASFGVNLEPNDSVTWQPNLELWAATNSGETSALSVLYNATGTTLGTVEASIANPVNVQGGGEELLADSGTVPAGGSIQFDIPAPASGLRYYGLQVFAQASGGDTDGAIGGAIFNNSIGGLNPGIEFTMSGNTFGANSIARFATPNRAWFIVPLATDYPVPIIFSNAGATDATIAVNVRGISNSLPYPVDAGIWEVGSFNPDQQISFANETTNRNILIASSFHDRVFNIDTTNSGNAGTVEVEGLNDSTMTWYSTETFPYHGVFGSTPTSNMIEPFTKSRFVVPGNGRLHRLIVTNNITGIARLSYRGRANGL